MLNTIITYTQKTQKIALAGAAGGLAVDSLFYLFNLPNQVIERIYLATQSSWDSMAENSAQTLLTLGGLYATGCGITYLSKCSYPTIALATIATVVFTTIMNVIAEEQGINLENSLADVMARDSIQAAFTIYALYSVKSIISGLLKDKLSILTLSAGMMGGLIGETWGEARWTGLISGVVAGITYTAMQQMREAPLSKKGWIEQQINQNTIRMNSLYKKRAPL
jgi:hypothetical protein